MDLKELLQKATENFEKQKALNEAQGVKLTKLIEQHADLKADFEKLKDGGDADAMQKIADAMEELQGKMETVMGKVENPVNAINSKEQKLAIQEIAKKAIGAYFKSGSKKQRDDFPEFIKAHATEQCKTLNLSSPETGGLAVAETLDRDVMDYAKDYSMISTLIMKKNSITRSYRQLIRITEPSIAEGIEAVAGTVPAETSTQTYVEVESKVFKLYAQPRITNEALAGTDINIYSELVALLGEEAGVYLNAQLLYGDGTGKNARGMLSSNRVNITDGTGESWKPTKTPDGTGARDPDFFPAYPTGVDGALGTTDKAIVDWLIDFMRQLNKRYRAGAKFVMTEATFDTFRKVRDADEKPILITNYMGTGEARLMGKPVELDETMPEIAAGATPIIYGDLTKAFAFNDGDIDQMLLDPYTKKGNLIVYMEKEYFEMIQRSDAIILGATTAFGPA